MVQSGRKQLITRATGLVWAFPIPVGERVCERWQLCTSSLLLLFLKKRNILF